MTSRLCFPNIHCALMTNTLFFNKSINFISTNLRARNPLLLNRVLFQSKLDIKLLISLKGLLCFLRHIQHFPKKANFNFIDIFVFIKLREYYN